MANHCRPQEIDEAARRRFVKRLYVPLPEREARKQIVQLLMSQQANSLTDEHFLDICDQTDGLSFSVPLKYSELLDFKTIKYKIRYVQMND